MSALVDRIAEVTVATMHAHIPRRLRGEPEMEECRAGCKYTPGGCYEHMAVHVAERIAAELNLIEETHTYADYETKVERGGEGAFRYAGQTSAYKGMKTVRRWVSGWAAVEDRS